MKPWHWVVVGITIAVVAGLVAWRTLDDRLDQAKDDRDKARAALQVAQNETASERRRMRIVRDSLQAARLEEQARADSAEAAADTARIDADHAGREARRLRHVLANRVDSAALVILDSLTAAHEAETRSLHRESFSLRVALNHERYGNKLLRAELAAADAFIAQQDSLIAQHERTLAAERRVAELLEAKLKPSLLKEALIAIPAAGACLGAGAIAGKGTQQAAVATACGIGYVGSRWLARR
jgi:hypothetical protein